MKENTLSIANNGKYNVKLISGKDSICLTNLPNDINCDSAWFSLFDKNNEEKNSQRVTKYKDQLAYHVQYEDPGHYSMQVMIPKAAGSSWYTMWLRNVPVIIDKDRMVYFESAPVYEHNVKVFNNLKKDMATLEKYKIVPSGCNKEIVSKAYEITKWCFTDYSKALAIHDWIAENIYYDWDSYTNCKIDYSKLGKASQVFSRKLAVCAGYSDLAVSMLRSLGIPAFSQSCYALGFSTSGRWTDKNVHNQSNHAITMVYLQKRWMIMDITWDSQNKYQHGSFQQKGHVDHRYFDPTLQYFSNTHKVCG